MTEDDTRELTERERLMLFIGFGYGVGATNRVYEKAGVVEEPKGGDALIARLKIMEEIHLFGLPVLYQTAAEEEDVVAHGHRAMHSFDVMLEQEATKEEMH